MAPVIITFEQENKKATITISETDESAHVKLNFEPEIDKDSKDLYANLAIRFLDLIAE